MGNTRIRKPNPFSGKWTISECKTQTHSKAFIGSIISRVTSDKDVGDRCCLYRNTRKKKNVTSTPDVGEQQGRYHMLINGDIETESLKILDYFYQKENSV